MKLETTRAILLDRPSCLLWDFTTLLSNSFQRIPARCVWATLLRFRGFRLRAEDVGLVHCKRLLLQISALYQLGQLGATSSSPLTA